MGEKNRSEHEKEYTQRCNGSKELNGTGFTCKKGSLELLGPQELAQLGVLAKTESKDRTSYF